MFPDFNLGLNPWRRACQPRPSARLLAAVLLVLLAAPAHTLVSYDEGQRTVKGVQLLRDFTDPNVFYYLPQYPRLAKAADGGFELICLKYLGAGGTSSGGLFHALVEFTLPEDVLADLEKDLKKDIPAARIAGPVPLMQTVDAGEEGLGSFQIVSSVLADRGEGGFTRTLVTSGKAPLTPGSKAVVAALLSPQGATLLFDSLQGPTSDVSVAIHAYYEAAVRAYNAQVSAESETVYTHFSRISNVQKEYTRTQLRKVVDDLQRSGAIKVEVLDRSKGLGIEAKDMEAILQVVTDKLVELMFDSQNGWAKDPEREAAVEANQIQGRQERGWFSRTFGGSEDTKYFTDDQYVLKRRTDIRSNRFVLNLGKTTTIKVPVDTAGNLGGLYDALGKEGRYFRVVHLDDPDFELREVFFQVDGATVDAFQDTVNFVTVNVRKTYADRPALTRSLTFTSSDIKAGKAIQSLSFPRLGDVSAKWTEFEYQMRWSLRDRPTITWPAKEDSWLRTSDSAVSLTPPFERKVYEVDADRASFAASGVVTGVIEIASVLAGKPRLERKATLRATDSEVTSKFAVFHDRETPIALRVTWHTTRKKIEAPLELLESDYLLLFPPAPETPAPPPVPPAEGGQPR